MKKSISKILSVFVLAAMLVAMTACGGEDMSNSKYTGNWEATSATTMGMTLDMATLGTTMTMELKSNGKAAVVFDGESGSGDWSETGTGVKITASDGTVEFTDKDGKLVMTESGVEFIFEKK